MDSLVRPFYEVPGKVISLKKDAYLFSEGDDAKYFYFVRSGQICVMKSVSSGRVLSLRLVKQSGIGNTRLEPKILAALLWIILFFSAAAGTDRIFENECSSGTILALKIYGPAQAVLFGKLLYNFCLLMILSCFTIPVFLVFMDVLPASPVLLFLAAAMGLWGFSAAGTLLAALCGMAAVHGGLFTVLTFPVVLPVFLLAINITTESFSEPGVILSSQFLGMLAYDIVLTCMASILFDYLWYEG